MTLLDKFLQNKVDAAWQPACGGTELPFQKDGKTYLYMWNPLTGQHAHYCETDDVFLSAAEASETIYGAN